VGLDAVIDDSSDLTIPVDAEQPFEYSDSHTCSSDAGAYDENGTYTGGAENTATITWTDGSDDSTANTSYTCEAAFVNLLKLLNGSEEYDQAFPFSLYAYFDTSDEEVIGTGTTPPAQIDFGDPALHLNVEYTICEGNVPAGFGTIWTTTISGIYDSETGNVIPFNPNTNDVPPADLGTRCFDFTPTSAGTTFSFTIDNTFPGGAPRTPGYWKNWNTCTDGGQAANAERNGGWQEGFWLLDDVISGGGVTWDDILVDEILFLYPIDDCQQAVLILDQREQTGRNKKMANDAAYTLAMHLLAAQLNYGAGACTTDDVEMWKAEAEELLDYHDFDGTGGYLRPNTKGIPDEYGYTQALLLAGLLDAYNNGEFCGDTIE
jgi:hypothetical protein